ncbi:tetratricopeptide repeat protein [Algoriphagus sp. D3-2-R+10]|uniref:tetratricopeptide repeat protein n=1 Tax=Algoriphagus aurantiacus TaxID=3103948 RepID=UPI002B3F3A20|nr:tetratricopeptide repeat protein [Algoriphagus sp. D3-2-R+10]MEB2778634.1 tetratricopeptide repeat protein [Algoriphagus sp. D3-2-R+10]
MKTNCRLFIMLALSCIFFTAWGQNNEETDSLLLAYKTQANDTNKVSTLHHLLDRYMYNDIEKAKAYALERLELSKKLNFEKGIANSFFTLGNYYYNINNLDSAKILYQNSYESYLKLNMDWGIRMANQQLAAVEYELGNYDRSIELFTQNIEQFGDSIGKPKTVVLDYQIRGMANTEKGNFKLALIDNLKALRLLEKLNDSLRMADALNSLGGIEGSLENFEKSLEYNFKALEIYKRKNDKTFAAQALNDIGNTYYYQKEYKKAIEFLKQSVALSNETKSINLESSALTNLGKSLASLEQYDEALKVLNQGLILAQKGDNKKKISESLNEIGITLNSVNRPQEAILYFKDALAFGDSTGSIATQSTSYFHRSKSFMDLGDYYNAYEDYQKYVILHDSIFNTTKSQQIEELRIIYDTEKKEYQLAQKEIEIALFEEREKVGSLQKWLLGSGLGLTLLVFGISFYGIRQKMKRNKLEKEKVDAELDFKKKELTTYAMHLAKKNEVLEQVKQKAREFKASEKGIQGYQQLIQTINFDQQDDKNWENFIQYFEQVHKDFSKTVTEKYPEVTKNELRLIALLKMNLSSKEIAVILNISTDGIKKARQRLRKKMELPPEESLETSILSL